MARLRGLCEEAGCSDVRTYIASGNVVFTSNLAAAQIRMKLEQAIHAEFGFSIAVVVLTAQQMAGVIKGNPFPDAQPDALHVAFATEPIAMPDIERLQKTDFGPEEIAIRDNLIYLHMPKGYGRSRLAAEVSKVKLPTTVRNWRTIGAVTEIADTES